MIVHYTFTVHPDRRDQVKAELRKLKAVVQKHGGRDFRCYASMSSGTPNRSFVYEIDRFAHFDSLNADPDFRAVKLDSLFTQATEVIWGEVEI
jgi:quinol monooxygenase YgiN